VLVCAKVQTRKSHIHKMATRGSYWEENGRYQEDYDYLWNELVPGEGRSYRPEGNLLAVATRIYNRRFNDGDDFHTAYENSPTEWLTPEDRNFILKFRNIYTPARYENFLDRVIERILGSMSTEKA
jgi:hypothetical protein